MALPVAERIKTARQGFLNDYRYLEGMLKQALKRG